MTTAIVTITCPSCGGKVQGIAATSSDQTVKCTYCGTDLHVPRVGEVVHERVVREVVHEVVQPVFEAGVAPDYQIRKRNPLAGLIAFAIMAPLLGLFICVQNQGTKDDMARFDRDRAAEKAARDTCEADCKDSCHAAGDKEVGKWDHLDDFSGSSLEQQMKDTDVLVCQTQCELQKNCMGLPPDRAKPRN